MTEGDITRRIDTLEERVAFQDDAIETLNLTVTRQWAQIDALTRNVERLTDQLRETQASASQGPQHEPPPHY